MPTSKTASLLVLLASTHLWAARVDAADYWVYQSDDPSDRALARVRLSPRANFTFADYKRPPRACGVGPVSVVEPTRRVAPLRLAQGGEFLFCPNDQSFEIGIGAGAEVAFRVTGPIYVTAALDFVYTAPESDFIKNQLVLTVPFGLMLTWYNWTVRPILQVNITPILYITDDSRDYTLGGAGGVAGRMVDWGDLSVLLGYHVADSFSGWQLLIAVHPIP